VLAACDRVRVMRMRGEVLAGQHAEQRLPELVGHAHHEDPAVAGPEELHRHGRGVRAARQALGAQALVQVPVAGVGELVQRDVEQRHVDVAAVAALHRADQRREHRHCGGDAGHVVDDRQAHAGGRRAGLAGEVQVAGLGLHQVVVARPALALVVATVGGEVRAEDARVRRPERGVVEAELLRLVAAQVVHDHVGGAHEAAKGGLALGALEVQRDALLVEVEGLEEVAVVGPEEVRSHAARGVAALFAALDLDDLGAEVGEVHRAERAGAEVLEGEYAEAQERQGGTHTGFLSTSWRAMMMRCISLVPSPMHMSGASR
jgi:hypothetical protein